MKNLSIPLVNEEGQFLGTLIQAHSNIFWIKDKSVFECFNYVFVFEVETPIPNHRRERLKALVLPNDDPARILAIMIILKRKVLAFHL